MPPTPPQDAVHELLNQVDAQDMGLDTQPARRTVSRLQTRLRALERLLVESANALPAPSTTPWPHPLLRLQQEATRLRAQPRLPSALGLPPRAPDTSPEAELLRSQRAHTLAEYRLRAAELRAHAARLQETGALAGAHQALLDAARWDDLAAPLAAHGATDPEQAGDHGICREGDTRV